VFVSIVDIRDDLLRVKKDNEIMRKERDRVHLQFDVGEQYGTGFGHTHRRPQRANIDCARLGPMVEACRLDGTAVLRDRRTDTFAFGNLIRRNESKSGTSPVTATRAMRAMDSQKVATRSAGVFVWKSSFNNKSHD
jgi:hypothetical protein